MHGAVVDPSVRAKRSVMVWYIDLGFQSAVLAADAEEMRLVIKRSPAKWRMVDRDIMAARICVTGRSEEEKKRVLMFQIKSDLINSRMHKDGRKEK